MASNWSNYTNDKISMREMTYKARMSDRIINSIVLLHTLTVFAYCFNVITADVDITDKTAELPFISKINIPINLSTESIYRCVSIMFFLHMIMCAWAAGITNGLLLSLVS